MLRNTLKLIAILILVTFTAGVILPQSQSYAAGKTGTIQIFSEVKRIEIFLDEKPQGKDMAVLNNVAVGSHYVKATKDGVTIYSEVVNVNADVTTTVLIKNTGQAQQNTGQVPQSKGNTPSTQQQEAYKTAKIDILLGKGSKTAGMNNTESKHFPGYYSIFGSSWTPNSDTTQYDKFDDWKIVQGGIREISDDVFATIVNDNDVLKMYNDNINTQFILGGAFCGLGALFFLASGGDTGAILVGSLFGIGGTVIMMGVGSSGHLTTPGKAAKEAYDYNLHLKKLGGLPESYEPQD